MNGDGRDAETGHELNRGKPIAALDKLAMAARRRTHRNRAMAEAQGKDLPRQGVKQRRTSGHIKYAYEDRKPPSSWTACEHRNEPKDRDHLNYVLSLRRFYPKVSFAGRGLPVHEATTI